MALTLYYLIASCSTELPWATCQKEWGDTCIDSSTKKNYSINSSTIGENNEIDIFSNIPTNKTIQYRSSAELYFS